MDPRTSLPAKALTNTPSHEPSAPSLRSPVYGFLKNSSMVDFEGHLAAVFFLSGCNFRCGFCHNAELMGQSRPGLPWTRLEEACRTLADNWVTGAVLTGGEPTLSQELPALIEFLKGYGWRIKLDTNGSNPDMLRRCLDQVDYVAMDIKTSLDHYPRLTGFQGIDRIQASIDLIRGRAADYEFRTTVIDEVHSDPHMDQIGAAIDGARRYILQPFVPSDRLPDPVFRRRPRTSAQRLHEIARRMTRHAEDVRVRGSDSH